MVRRLIIKGANIKDVAKAAGVAVSTVSRVLNNHSDVKKETKERVLKIMEQLNYVPNNSARNLKRTTSNSIGLFVLGESNPFFGDIVESLESQISNRGYSVMVHFHHGEADAIEEAVQFVLEKKLLGLIFLGGVVSKEKERLLDGLEAPVVFTSTFIEEGVEGRNFSSVAINEKAAVEVVMDYLLSLGHRRIGIITGDRKGVSASAQRFLAYKQSLESNGLSISQELILNGDYSIESGFSATTKLLEENIDFTAIFAVNDLMAIGAIKAITLKGLNVPDDISVIGFDGLDYGKFYNPSITTVKQPNSMFSLSSIETLFNILEDGGHNQHLTLETSFIERESCKNITISTL